MTTEIIEGEAVEVPEARALSVIEPSHRQGHLAVGVGALASMTDEDFDKNLSMLEKGVERAGRIKRAIMTENEDYGLIPGTNKPSLLKPGAEKLALAYGLTGSFAHNITYGDGEATPPITVVVDSYLHLGGSDGPIVAQGMGMASSWEKRYRWRKGGRVCPTCGKAGLLMTKRDQWWHPADAKPDGGCGGNFPKDDPAVVGQEVGDVENPDPYELGNTLLKMAEKRAYVDAVLRATASSGLFTQDMEDDEGDGHPAPARATQRPVGQHATPPDRAPLTRTTHEDGLSGVANLGKDKGTSTGTDYLLREEASRGHVIGFRLTQGRKGYKVLAFDPLASALASQNIIGEQVTCWGVMKDESFTDEKTKHTVTYQIMHLERIATPDFVLPSPVIDDDLSDLDF